MKRYLLAGHWSVSLFTRLSRSERSRTKSGHSRRLPSGGGIFFLLAAVLGSALPAFAASITRGRITLEIPVPPGYVEAPDPFKIGFAVSRSLTDHLSGELFNVFVNEGYDPGLTAVRPKRTLAIALGEGKISHIPTSYWAFRKVADTLREASLSLPKAPRARDNTSVPEIPADTTARYKFINENAYAGWILLNSRARKDAPPEITARATLYILVYLQIFIAELTLLEPTWGELKDLENFLEDYLPGIRLTHGEFEDQHPDAPPPEW